MNPAEAKAWLIQQILAEAMHRGVALDPLETRMLEYSETEHTPPDLEELNAEFDQRHDQAEYEAKLAAMIRRMLAEWRAAKDPRLNRWHDAVIALSSQDHYLMGMISRAQGAAPKHAGRPPFDRLKLALTAIGLLAFALLFRTLIERLR